MSISRFVHLLHGPESDAATPHQGAHSPRQEFSREARRDDVEALLGHSSLGARTVSRLLRAVVRPLPFFFEDPFSMMNSKLSSSLAAAASLALLAACGGTATDAGSRVAAPTGASYVLTTASVGDAGDNTPNQGEVEICKFGTAAAFDVGPTGGATTRYNLADGECKVVVVDLTQANTANSYTIQEVADAAYQLQSIQRTDIQFAVGTTTDIVGAPFLTNDPITALVNYYHGVRLVYHNNPVVQTGCTYTKGWYRNNGSNTIIAVDGRTVGQEQQIFAATPGKPGSVTFGADNNNLNLYQQLLAALNNLNGDATAGPPALDAAIAAALAATSGTGTNIIVAPGTDVSGLISALSSFNEGELAGWPHCAD
ncbi:MAG: hypothetical protein ACJ79A_19380 [Gemmatimonadaceae bacterium]